MSDRQIRTRVRNLIERSCSASESVREIFSTVRVSVVSPYDHLAIANGTDAQVLEISSGRGRNPKHLIFVDDSDEGYRPDHYLVVVKALVDKFGVRPEHVIVLTQNEDFHLGPRQRPAAGEVNASVFNRQFEQAVSFASHDSVFSSEVSLRPGYYRSRFLVLSNIPRPHRIALFALMSHFGLLESAAASFHLTSRTDSRNLAFFRKEAVATFPEYAALIDRFLNLAPLPMVLDGQEWREDFWALPEVAQQTLWFLVLESNFGLSYESFPSRRVTEKTMKALVFGRPFVLVGQPYTLSYLRELGFLTYGSVLDETYDQIDLPGKRITEIVAVLRLLGDQKISRGFLKECRRISRANLSWLRGGFASHVQARQVKSLESALCKAGF